MKDAEDFRKFADSALLANPILKNYKNWILVKGMAEPAALDCLKIGRQFRLACKILEKQRQEG
ncbi:MAG: hypothetical protein ACLUKN_04510 [Bacilli bacterium]